VVLRKTWPGGGVVRVSSAMSVRCHIPKSGKRASPASYWFHEMPRQQVLLENAPSTGLVKDHVSESGKRCPSVSSETKMRARLVLEGKMIEK
jgi:hypothetical protein